MSKQEESRARAREECTKRYLNHEREQGRNPSYDSVKRFVNERADVQDKRKDWNIKDK